MKYLRSQLTGADMWINEQRQLHRQGGPAYILEEHKEWWINGTRYYNNKSFQKAANLSDEDMIAIVLKYGNVT
jgi:uncharacterized protein YfaQ (DUF2300 family)